MKRLLFLFAGLALATAQAAPLRVFIRGGAKSHGPNAHEHERFLNEWKPLLTSRGIVTDGAKDWPTAEQLGKTDVLLMYAQDGGNATPEQKANLAEFTRRGGGIVVIHTASVSNDPVWWKSVIGGAWVDGKTKYKEGPMDLYYVENQFIEGRHPITVGASNFHLDDEIYYDMDLSPDIRVLATSYTPKVPEGKRPSEGGGPHIYDIQPQMWAYEKDNYRAFVSLPGHLWGTFEKPAYRAVLLRGIAWAGKRANLDEFSKPEEISSLTYPEGGPRKPEETLKNLEIHPEFDFKLIAAEPLITKPMNFDWDASGRLWVAETPEYPNGRRGMRPDYRGKEWKDHGGVDPEPGQQDRKAIDKISILTDTNGDGVMDKKEIFFEGLELVTGLVFYKDGVIVTQAPDILWLRDTDQDGKADKIEKLFTGLGTGDTHAVINNPRWGWDGWVYATQGYSGSDRVLNAKGEKMPVVGSGVVRFKPDGSVIEQYSSKGGNTWGLEITGDNRVMWTQPTSGDLLMQTVLPEYALARAKVGKTASFHVVEQSKKTFPLMSWEQQAYRQIDWVGSFTAAAGCVVYDGGSWPAEYNGDYFTTEPTINIVHHTRLTPQGVSSTFRKLPGREETEFIRSKDMWWRPIEVRVGPDGAVYLGDFYNQAVIHNDTRGPDHNKVNAAVRPDRDHYFGRIWKIDHKNATKLKVPDLAKATPAQIVAALDHPNRAVRLLASRILIDRRETSAIPAIQALMEKGKSPDTRIAAMWTLHGLGAVKPAAIQARMADSDAAVRRNAAGVVEASGKDGGPSLLKLASDPEAPVRLHALRALAAVPAADADAATLLAQWPKFDDDFQRSAALGALTREPASAIAALLDTTDASLAPLASQLAQGLAEKNDTAAAARLVIALAAKPASADPLKRGILDTLVRSLKDTPEITPPLAKALDTLLLGGAGDNTLPLAAKWAKTGTFNSSITGLNSSITRLTLVLFERLKDGSEEQRLSAARTLLGMRTQWPEAVPCAIDALNSGGSPAFKRDLVLILGETGGADIGTPLAAALAKLPIEAQTAAFEVLLQRSDRALALIEVLAKKQVDVAIFGPANLARLRTHPDREVSKRAGTVLDELMGPALKAKGEILAKLLAEVEKPGDPAKGKALFAASCAICHKYGDDGADVGPALTGMGSHGISELLTAIVDPNREVDPSFSTWNIETKDGSFHAGIIARENPASLVLKSLAGQEEIRIADIKSRVNTGRSLMPEGLEGLGGEALRDILAYLCGTDAVKFRTLDLRNVFTADTRKGLYQSQAAVNDTLPFRRFGTQEIEKIPFNVIDPSKGTNGNNILVLKGGAPNSFSGGLAQKVEVKVGGFKANRLHFLGGVTGWGYQGGGETSPVMKATVFYADGANEELIFRNGVEFSDYFRRTDVPGSKFVDVLKDHQVRFFSKQLNRTGVIDRIVLESFATGAAPTLAAITAELADPGAPPLPGPTAVAKPAFKPQFSDPVPQPPAQAPAKGPRVLLVGGGSSHDFVKFFGNTDKATLEPAVGWVAFTQNANGLADILKNIDVLVWSANQPVSDETKKLLIDYANSGKGLIALHPGTWYAWPDFPQWNKEIVGGGTRGHDALGEYPMKIVNPDHPVTKGVTPEFRIVDELYNHIPDPQATPVEILATATSPKSGKVFPQVWVVKHPKSRIVGITLGHDERAHDLPEYRTLLRNAVLWSAGR